ncbi:MAG: YicC family protein [Candidatus Hydrogenedentota bacterium]|nr:MAG: YicC family protein [Candidatus Hydrogenedentota bacterium]
MPLKSMTGFGQASRTEETFSVFCEIRSWNYRGLDLQFRLPETYNALEPILRSEFAPVVERGKVIVGVRLTGASVESRIVINEPLARALSETTRRIAEETGATFTLSPRDLVSLPEMLDVIDSASDAVAELIRHTARKALEVWDQSRICEAARLLPDMNRNLEILGEVIEVIRGRAPDAREERRAKLIQTLREIAQDHTVSLDEQRLEFEAAQMAERADINEELVRLDSHSIAVKNLLGAGPTKTSDTSSSSARGQKMLFLLQELLREMNTIGSKVGDLEIVQAVVRGKTAIDRLKEMAANIV